jgi:predicted lipoprotein with Yx(FWY)xxD motif
MRHLSVVALGAVATAAAVAGCGGNGGGSGGGGGGYVSMRPAAATTAKARPTHVNVGNSSLGKHLVNGGGRTLYLFTADHTSRSTCSGNCASIWPPVITHGRPVGGRGVTASLLSTHARSRGVTQVVYNGHPLYTFQSDNSHGNVTGEGITHFGGIFYAVTPAGKALKPRQRRSTTTTTTSSSSSPPYQYPSYP